MRARCRPLLAPCLPPRWPRPRYQGAGGSRNRPSRSRPSPRAWTTLGAAVPAGRPDAGHRAAGPHAHRRQGRQDVAAARGRARPSTCAARAACWMWRWRPILRRRGCCSSPSRSRAAAAQRHQRRARPARRAGRRRPARRREDHLPAGAGLRLEPCISARASSSIADGNLFVTTGDRYSARDEAQNPANHLGKVVRITARWRRAAPTIPSATGWRPEIWSIGHRNVQGAALQPGQRPSCGRSSTARAAATRSTCRETGKNYGWPVITYGRDYSLRQDRRGHGRRPGWSSRSTIGILRIAPSGAAFYTGDLFPDWKGNLFVGALAGQALHRLVLDGEKVVGEEVLLKDLRERIRDVRQGPDGAIWLLTDDPQGRVLRVVPASGNRPPGRSPVVPRSPGPRGCRLPSACGTELRSLAFSFWPITQSLFLSSSRNAGLGLSTTSADVTLPSPLPSKYSKLAMTNGDPRAPWPRTPGADRAPSLVGSRRRQTARPRTVSTPHSVTWPSPVDIPGHGRRDEGAIDRGCRPLRRA